MEGEGGKRTRNAVKSAHKEADDAETKLREVRKLHALAHFSLYLSFYFFFFLSLAPFVVSLSSFTMSTLTLYAIRFPLLFILTLSSLSFFLLLQEALREEKEEREKKIIKEVEAEARGKAKEKKK